jgi:hypothetical protein
VVVRLRAGKRSVHVVAGRTVTLRVPRGQRRVPAGYAVDGRRFKASIALRRQRRARFAG